MSVSKFFSYIVPYFNQRETPEVSPSYNLIVASGFHFSPVKVFSILLYFFQDVSATAWVK